jgi:hypothetical protein
MTPRPKTKVDEKAKEFDALESAASLIVNAMATPQAIAILRETAEAQFIPLWMLVCGLLQKCYEMGEHSAPILDPLWLRSAPTKMGGYAEVTCHCGKLFRPRWPGQEYCGVECGAIANRDRVAADRAVKLVELETYAVGEEPLDRARSTVRSGEADERADAPRQAGERVGIVGGLTEREDPIAEIERQAQIEVG